VSIVQNFPTDLNTPAVLLRVAEPTPSIQGNGIGVVGVVAQAIRGPVGVPTMVGSLSEFIRKFGGYDANLNEGFNFVRNIFTQGATAVKIVRVTDGTDAAATLTVSGTTFKLGTPGTWGNNVTLTVQASSVTGYVDLLFAYGAGEQYAFQQVTFTNAADPRNVSDVMNAAGDEFVTIATLGTQQLGTGTFTFTGGTCGATTGAAANDSIYIGTDTSSGKTGLVAFEADDEINFITSARSNTAVNAALVAHVQNVNVPPRIAIVAPAQGTAVSAVVTAMAAINSERVIMAYPWLQISNPYSKKKEYHSPVAFYAGVLATLSYEQSPSQEQVQGVIGTERALSKSDVDTLGKNRVSPITLVTGQGFVIRNGYNASSDPSKRNTTRTRAVNFFAVALERGSAQFVSKPHTLKLRQDVKSAFGSLIEQELNAGRIGNVNGGPAYAVKCDAQNNPTASVQANKLIVDVQISLLAPADFIMITLDASEAKVVTLQ
jgi:hypothetical protein